VELKSAYCVGGVSQIGETRHVRDKRNAGKADAEVVTYHDEREERNAGARERESGIRGNRRCLHNAPMTSARM